MSVTVIIYSIVVLAIFFLIIMAIDANRFVVREYSCKSKSLKKNISFVLLSDLHNKSFGTHNKKLLAAISEISPEAILIAGDMYTSVPGRSTKTAAELVCELANHYPVYYGIGNHEQKTEAYPDKFGTMYQDFMKQMVLAGVEVLDNTKVFLPNENISIYGLKADLSYYGKFKKQHMKTEYLNELLGKANADSFQLMIAHNPDYFEAYATWGADLVVSGHIHGGLMKLPVFGGVISPTLRLFPKYDGGRFRYGKSTMILSRGLGTHTLPIRIFNPGELIVIRCEVDC